MTRASIGVQDFSPQVQEAINRPQTFDETRRVVEALRNSGVRSLNIDALYGLPRQTRERLQDTIEKVIALSPDRIALFGYAHVPWMKKHQRLIDESELPGPAERMAQAASAGAQIAAAGYRRIGIDHFARPSDSLAKAQEEGRLRRNFQGYTDDAASVLIGIGASSISQSPLAIVQNEVAIGRYRAAVDGGRLAPARGIVLGRDDRIRAWIIERLMCDFGFSFARLRNEFGGDADEYVALADSIAAGDREGLCVVTDGGFEIRETARPFTRIVASRFDAHLQNGPARYSKAV